MQSPFSKRLCARCVAQSPHPLECTDALTGRSYPPPDLVARLFDTIEPNQLSGRFYAWYLALLFDAVLDELQVMGGSRFPTRADLARAWRSHLLRDGGEGRDRIYYKILDCIGEAAEYSKYWTQRTVEQMPKAYDKLEAAIRSRSLEECDKRDPLVVLYFDETRSLTRTEKHTTRPNTQGNSLGSAKKRPTSSGGCIYRMPLCVGPSRVSTDDPALPSSFRPPHLPARHERPHVREYRSQKHPSTATRPSQSPHLNIPWLRRPGLDSW